MSKQIPKTIPSCILQHMRPNYWEANIFSTRLLAVACAGGVDKGQCEVTHHSLELASPLLLLFIVLGGDQLRLFQTK